MISHENAVWSSQDVDESVIHTDSDVDRTQILTSLWSRVIIVRNIVGLIVHKRQHYSRVRYCTDALERNSYITPTSLLSSVQCLYILTEHLSGYFGRFILQTIRTTIRSVKVRPYNIYRNGCIIIVICKYCSSTRKTIIVIDPNDRNSRNGIPIPR